MCVERASIRCSIGVGIADTDSLYREQPWIKVQLSFGQIVPETAKKSDATFEGKISKPRRTLVSAHQSREDVGDGRGARAPRHRPLEQPDVAAVDPGRRGDDAVHPGAEGGEAAQQVEAERARHGGGVEDLQEISMSRGLKNTR